MNNYKKMSNYKNSFRNVLMVLMDGTVLAATIVFAGCKDDEPKPALDVDKTAIDAATTAIAFISSFR